jgi:glycine/D-amino acid oxidase-like deaminating enzyme
VLVDGQLGVNPQRLAAALSTRAVTVFTGVRMLEITKSGTVRTTAGDFTPGAIVLATGLLPKPWQTRQRWVKGHMVAVAPGPWRLNSVLAGPLGGGTPLSDGTIFCGGTFDEGDSSPDVRPEIADSLAEGLARVLPKAAGARASHRWCCFRPYIEGRQPVIDRLPDVPNGWFAGGHFTTGIMMAAATGEAVAQWIATGTAPDLVRTFTLDR